MSELERFQERIRDAISRKAMLNIQGGNSKAFLGNTPQGESFEVKAYRGIVSYEPTELVITASAGTLLSELEATLAQKQQCLPFEPPYFGSTATVGGMVAAGIAGPSRAYVGGVRDYILGAELINGKAELLRFGGQVMKNVAGYDVSRVLAGSLGVLGVITEVSLKVLPIAPHSCTLQFELGETDALLKLNTWAGQPLPLNASVWHQGMLYVRLRGARPAIDAARHLMGGTVMLAADTAALWQSLRDQTHTFFDLPAHQCLWRISIPPTTQPLALGPQLIEWGGGQRWLKLDVNDAQAASAVQTEAIKAGGHARCFRGGARQHSMAAIQPSLAGIHQRLKAAFDPHGVFNRGRLFTEL